MNNKKKINTNILFYTPFQVSERQGGTERVTARVSEGLRKLGYRCYSAFSISVDSNLPLVEFDGVANLSEASVSEVLVRWDIDIVIVQTMTRKLKQLSELVQMCNKKIVIVSVLHFNPGFEEQRLSYKTFIGSLAGKGRMCQIFGFLLYPIYKAVYPRRNRELYRIVYKYSDRVVVLASSFIEEYANYAELGKIDKLISIPNPLSYDNFLVEEELAEKKHQVLMVCRLDEVQKRVSLALNVWKEIEQSSSFSGWKFKIVGDGTDRDALQQYAKNLGLQRVEFCGNQDPISYYKESMLFLMTSLYEGWGVTLTEAQQFGCVPVAFDTYSSLHDIIQNGENGLIVPETDIKEYTNSLKGLMSDEAKWRSFAQRSIMTSHRFELRNIVGQWDNLIGSLLPK